MIECAISFEKNPSGIFYSGSIINGTVQVTVDKPTTVQSVLLVISGEANVRWSEDEGTGDNRSSVYYYANDNYIKSTTYLYGSENGITVTINPGSHIYTFTCALPPELPSSVEGHYGKVRYSAKVIFDRPWKFNKTFTKGITIVKITDLNHENPQIKLPATLEIQKQFWCFCCISRPLIIEGTISKSGFVSGEYIPVKFNIFNMSTNTVQRISVSLKQIITSKSDHPRKKSKIQTINLTKTSINSIKNSQKEEFNTNLLVPPVPPTCNEEICRVVHVNYEVHIKAIINGPHIAPVLKIPLVIGNVPLDLNVKNYINTAESTDPSLSNARTPEVSAVEFGLPPPTYEEALYIEQVNMNAEEKHPIADSNYLPRYPVFQFGQSIP
ncbi:arrestin domain-containing protein 17-like [Condylostylus longicornis]|uniref:arrestin domain-containing protein 17-like n=1 Tax=Condylostylus longicornis TaxID=2530218 RepID=UPI00244E1BCB|nr:arrestin domain-containing protein 17-like [Condylostylus longicornis]